MKNYLEFEAFRILCHELLAQLRSANHLDTTIEKARYLT